jgi:hypothetical protein
VTDPAEIDVVSSAHDDGGLSSMTCLSLKVIRFCAEEVERQRDKPITVLHMCEAWSKAMNAFQEWKSVCGESTALKAVAPRLIEEWGEWINPTKNHQGYVGVGVRHRMHGLCLDIHEDRLLPAEAYRRFAEIAPFRDGNGPVGALLYNWLLGTLDDPRTPLDAIAVA